MADAEPILVEPPPPYAADPKGPDLYRRHLLAVGEKAEVVLRINDKDAMTLGPWTAPVPKSGKSCMIQVRIRVTDESAVTTFAEPKPPVGPGPIGP